MEELERHLSDLGSRDERLKLLEAQWIYDRTLVAQALQSVQAVFPHYARHDVSHSNTILINITRVLGTRLSSLSATDTWLILEAAYWHDVGMIVSDRDIRAWWCSDAFQEHVVRLTESEDPILARSARLLSPRPLLSERAVEWPVDIRQALTYVVAEFARSLHAQRPADAVRSPRLQHVNSPRSLIPARLFECLADVCHAHGRTTNDVMEISSKENGIGHDTCHPRFVACMLRLGDLLDLDNGRFCPTMTASIGDVPYTSRAHAAKHASIRSFHVSPEQIDVRALCKEDKPGDVKIAHASFEAVSEWLEWLRAELTFIGAKWSSIAPTGLGQPPSVGTIEATLEGYEKMPAGFSPRFDVDREYFLNLSKSNSLFGSPHTAWQRELITNAADATFIAIWKTLSPEEQESLTNSEDIIGAIRERARSLPIRMVITPTGAPSGSPPTREWTIRISDGGIGMTPDDVNSLQIVGSSRKNRARRSIVEKMPAPLQPTGSFGLGFQSVFLDTDEVLIETRHLLTGVARAIEIFRPSHQNGPNVENAATPGVFVRRLASCPIPQGRSGTTIEFKVRRPPNFGVLQSGDPVTPTSGTPTDAAWRKEIAASCGGLVVPVLVNGEAVESPEFSRYFTYVDAETWMQITFIESKQVADDELFTSMDFEGRCATEHCFRGARVELTHSNATILGYSADLYTGSASDYLVVNRTSFTGSGKSDFLNRVEKTLPRAARALLRKTRDSNDGPPDVRAAASLLTALGDEADVEEEWKQLLLPFVSENGRERLTRLGDLFERDFITVRTPGHHGVTRWSSEQPIIAKIEIESGSYYLPPKGFSIIKELIRRRFPQIHWRSFDGPFLGLQRLYLDVVDLDAAPKPAAHRIGGEAAKDWVSEGVITTLAMTGFPGRGKLPCAGRFAPLECGEFETNRIPSGAGMYSPFTHFGDPFAGQVAVRCVNIRNYLCHSLAAPASKTSPNKTVETIADAALALVRMLTASYSSSPTIFKLEYSIDEVERLVCEWRATASSEAVP